MSSKRRANKEKIKEIILKNKLTIVIPTHIIPSAPDVSILKASLNSLATYEDLHGCNCIITCDIDISNGEIAYEYLLNIEKIKTPFNVILSLVINGQQRANFLNGIKQVQTPYMLFWEHDWRFYANAEPRFKELIEMMDKYTFINTIFFNKRNNVELPYPCGDFILIHDYRIKELPLLKTSKWSNNPNISRISTWKNWWIPLLESAPVDKSNPRKQVEAPLHYAYMRDMGITNLQNIDKNKLHFLKAHDKWGMYSFGKKGQNKMVLHMDGNR